MKVVPIPWTANKAVFQGLYVIARVRAIALDSIAIAVHDDVLFSNWREKLRITVCEFKKINFQ